MYIPLILFILMLIFPGLTKAGAYNGLILWFNTIIPTLLPFMIVNGAICYFNAFSIVSKLLYPITGRIFKISKDANYCLIMGFLCGFPMGSKVIADMLKSGKITLSEASYLLSFCNNLSPAFLISYVGPAILLNCYRISAHRLHLFYFIIFFSPILVSFIYRIVEKYNSYATIGKPTSSTTISDDESFNFLDKCILDAFDNIFKIGGYIIIFSIISMWILSTPVINANHGFVLSSLFEITSGLFSLKHTSLGARQALLSTLFLCSFGGLCSVAQTYSMIADTKLKLSSYLRYKFLNGIISLILGLILL